MSTQHQLIPDPAVRPTMRVEEICEPLNLSRSSAYEAVQRGDIPSIRLGRRILIPTAAIRKMLCLDSGSEAA